jgi:AcrR family transcriptional regulator
MGIQEKAVRILMNVGIDPSGEVLPKQRRSRARRAAMIEQGVHLLNDRDLDDLPVADITGALGYSTGSFYSAFSDKTAFFVAVQRQVNDSLDQRIADELETGDIQTMRLAERLVQCVEFTLEYFRTYRGVIRCALRYEDRIPDAWAPNRASAQRINDAMIRGLEGDRRAAMQTAIQVAFGTMVNSLLHDPGPLRLDDPAFGPSVTGALAPYLNQFDQTSE